MKYKDYVTKGKHLSLKGKIKGMAAMGASVRSSIAEAKKQRHSTERLQRLIYLNWAKYELGQEQRHHLIAYGLLRGLPYKKIENKVGVGNQADPDLVFKIIDEHVRTFAYPKWTVHTVRELMSDKGSEKEAA